MKTTMTATLVLLATAAAPGAAQAVGQADVQIQSLSVTAARVRPTLDPNTGNNHDEKVAP